MRTMRQYRLLVAALAAACGAAWVLPGTQAKPYRTGDPVELKVNKLTSPRTHLGYEYYKLAFCPPPGGIRAAAENLGEHLTGETIENSAFELRMRVNEYCKLLCVQQLNGDQVRDFVTRIDQDYNVNWFVDMLPAAGVGLLEDANAKLYARGIPIGAVEVDTGNHFVYNHAKLLIKYNEDVNSAVEPEKRVNKVVGFEVRPLSVLQATAIHENCDAEAGGMPVEPATPVPHMIIAGKVGDDEVKDPSVVFSYDVEWEASDIQWASRWDLYLSMGGNNQEGVHWFSIVNSMIISVFLTGMVAMIMVRALRTDITRYNRVPTEEEKAEEREETGWKLVHGDVFRPPTRFAFLFAVFAGIGAQLIAMAGITIVFAAIGFLSPANRGSLVIAALLLFLFMGVLAGYTTARVHKLFNGTAWQRVTLATALGFPGFIFTALFIMNLFVWSAKSTNAVPFTSMLTVLCLWLLVSVPLVFLGAYYGFRADKIELPVRVSSMPRPVPPQPWYLFAPLAMLVGGILPFGTVFVELFFILTSIWQDHYYYVFGFLLLVYALLLITCAEISIVLTYFQLCAEDYRWWWRSLLVPGASGVYLFLYCCAYYSTYLQITGWMSQMLYFGYMGLVALAFSFVTGVTGFFATFWFVRTIYGAIKVD